MVLRRIIIFYILLIATSAASSALGDDLRGFWQQGAASDWEIKPAPNSSKIIKFEDQPHLKKIKADEQKTSLPPEQHPKETSQDPKSREDVIAKYGDPSKNQGYIPVDTAPAEFKGLAAAMNIGDKELAFQYARAHVKKMKQFEEFISKATQYQVLAMETEGMRPPIDPNDPDQVITEERKELKNVLAKANQEKMTAEQQRVFDDQAKQMLEEDDAQVAQAQRVNTQPDLQVTVDPEGKVKVLLFFSLNDPSTREMVANMETLIKKLGADKRITFVGLIRETMSPLQIELMRRAGNVQLPIQNGEALIKQLKITEVPAVLFVSESTKKIYTLKGVHGADEIEKVIRLMQGGN